MRLNGGALASIVAVTLRMNLRRFTVWVFGAVFLWIVYLLYWGPLGFGGMTSSGAKLATNSEYAIAATLGFFSFFLMHFTATLTGDPVVVDVRLGTSPLLRAMPIDRGTYLLGKFLGGYASLLTIYLVFLVALILGQFLPSGENKVTLEIPRLVPYLKFAFLFMFVPTYFVGTVSFAIGSLSGSMKLVYIAVTALFVSWLLLFDLVPDEHYRWLAWLEPSGTLWLDEYVAKSRGNNWLNRNPIVPDVPFLLNRIALLGFGTACLGVTLAVFRGADLDAEYGGEVKPGWLGRLGSWARGSHRELEDRYTNWSGSGAIPRVKPAPRGVRLWCSHLCSSTATEVRLLGAERSLWIMVPVIVVLAVFTTGSAAGPFRVPIYPVSSEFAGRMVSPLLLLIGGTSIFYTGEVFHRDEASGVRSIIYSTPAANSVILGAKLLAMLALSSAMVLISYATAMATQLVLWWQLEQRVYFDPGPYLQLGLHVMLPAIVVICGLSLAVNVIARGRYVAYFLLIALGALYVWGVSDDARSLRINPLLLGHLRYSDMTGLEPFRLALTLHHAYWGSLVALALLVATWMFSRSAAREWKPRRYLAAGYVRRRSGLLAFIVLAGVGVAWGWLELRAQETVRGSERERERTALELERAYGAELWSPGAAYTDLDLEVDLWPDRGAVDVRGRLTLVNERESELAQLRFTVDPLFEIERLELERAAGPYTLDRGVLTVPLEPALPPGASVRMELDWSGRINPGISENGAPRTSFVYPSASFLSSLSPQLVPLPGVHPDLFLQDEQTRADHGLAPVLLEDRSGDPAVTAFSGSNRPFDLAVRITVPAGQTAVTGGELIERTPVGDPARGSDSPRTAFRYRTRHPVRSFAILAAPFEVRRGGPDEVWYHGEHTYNLDTVFEALADGREFYEQHFGAYPHRQLRIVELPRVATFAQSFPSLTPYSEAVGFLTNYRDNDRFLDATYFVTAHEVAHQWWGYLVSPAASLGAQVLSESLAEYSAIALLGEKRGERARLICLRLEEERYLRRRDPDREAPLSRLALEGQAIWYGKGGLVFHMLEQEIGRPALFGALAELVERFRYTEGAPMRHATVTDLLDLLADAHPGRELGWFYETWFHRKVVPDMALVGRPQLVREASGWSVHFEATNVGEEDLPPLPVEVELVAGNWRAGDRDSMRAGEWRVSPPMRLWLEPGTTARGTLSADFEPEAIVIDRRYACIDFDRTNNWRALSEAGPEPGTPREQGSTAQAGSAQAPR